MKLTVATPIAAALGVFIWGCATAAPVAPVAENASGEALIEDPAVAPTPAPAQVGLPQEAPAVAPAPAPAQVGLPQLGLGGEDEAAQALPTAVQRFIDSMSGRGPGHLNAAWITADQARPHVEAVVPAILYGLTRTDTVTRARQLLVDIGPRAAPYVKTGLDQLRREAGTDPTVQRGIRLAEQLLSGWR